MHEPKKDGKRSHTAKSDRRKRIERYFRRHYKLFAILGSLIISLSIALKDKFQERIREFGSRIETEENLFKTEQAEKRNNDRIENLQRNITKWQIPKGQDTMQRPALDEISIQLDLRDIQDSLGEVEKVALLLADAGRGARQNVEKLHGEIEEILRKENEVSDKEAMDFALQKPPTAENHALEMEIDRRIEILRRESDNITFMVFGELEKAREQQERRLVLIAAVSYSLIALGFLLSLTGHIAGRDGEIPEIKF